MIHYFNQHDRPDLCSKRIFILSGLACIIFIGIICFGLVQIFKYYPELQKMSDGRYQKSRLLLEHRGDIYGNMPELPLAKNVDVYDVDADLIKMRKTYTPAQLNDIAAPKIASVLGDPVAVVREKLSSSRDRVSLKKSLPAFVIKKLEMLGVNGLLPVYKSNRFYPNGEMFAHIVGFTDYKGVGKSGVEFMRHQQLSPIDGYEKFLNAQGGNILHEHDFRPALSGDHLYLTVSPRLQYATYRALKWAHQHYRAKAASALVLDINDGGILAMANYPSFNPNRITAIGQSMRNRAIADRVEPGSSVKPFVAAMALEQNQITPIEIFPTSKQPLNVGALQVRDRHIKEDLDATGIIRESSNIGAVLMAHRVGKEYLWQTYRALGLGGEPVLEMREESDGELRHFTRWRRSDFATHAYGYGFSTTLLQLLRAFSVFATDGRLIEPTLEQSSAGGVGRRVFSANTARQVRAMMEAVVTPDGTAPAAAIPGYRVAGKTGTVEKFIDNKYQNNKVRAFFVGMAPASKPRYLIAVMVDEPKKANGEPAGGGRAAAPVFHHIMRRALFYGGIPPDAMPKGQRV